MSDEKMIEVMARSLVDQLMPYNAKYFSTPSFDMIRKDAKTMLSAIKPMILDSVELCPCVVYAEDDAKDLKIKQTPRCASCQGRGVIWKEAA